jgi:hypothetical protein
MSEEAIIVNGVELNLKCYSCEQVGQRQPRIGTPTELRKHLKTHGKIVTPLRHPGAGHVPSEVKA